MGSVAKTIGGAIINPIGTLAGAVGAPPGVAAALNPMGAGIQAATGMGGPAGGVLSSLDPSNINRFRATAPVNSFGAVPQNFGFNAQQAGLSESNYANAIQQAQGFQQQVQPWMHAEQDRASDSANQMTAASGNVTGGTVGQEQSLADALRAQMQGQGPSLAQLQFQHNLDQSLAATASSMGSVRGINPGAAARMTSMGQAGQLQGAVNSAAQQRMAEQLAAEQQLGGVLGNMGNLQLGQQGQTLQGLQGAGALHLGAGNLALGQYGAATQAMGTAGSLQNQQNSNRITNLNNAQTLNQATGFENAQLAQQAQDINAQVAAQNAALKQGAQQINAGIAGQNSAGMQSMIGGGLGAAGTAIAGLLNQGGEVPSHIVPNYGGERGMSVPGYASGGSIPYEQSILRFVREGQTGIPQFPSGDMSTGMSSAMQSLLSKGPAAPPSTGSFPNSPLMGTLPIGSPNASPWPGAAPLMAGGGDVAGAVPGKAEVDGDSPKNDKVPIEASPGEIVLPRSVALAPDAPERAARFVAAIRAKHRFAGRV